MTQRISFGKISGTGIIVVLAIIGVILILTGIAPGWGYTAIGAAVVIGILYAVLGAAGILKRLAR